MQTIPGPALWPHQQDAVDSLTAAFKEKNRATVVMACGTGKTRTAAATVQALAHQSSVRRVLVVVPFLELITQTFSDWREVLGDAGMGQVVAVCSDKDVLREQPQLQEQCAAVTTEAEELARLVAGQGQITVATTYASLPTIVAAHAEHGLPAWDLIIPDEAHRTAGRGDKVSAMVHSNEFIPATRRMYMTATPKIISRGGDDAVSMKDGNVYGDVVYRLGFSRAITLGLLANYRIIVPVVTDEQVRAAANDPDSAFYQTGRSAVSPAVLATQIALLRAAHEYGLRRMITFHNRVLAARWFASTLPHAIENLDPLERPADLSVGHVHGVQSLIARQRTLARLRADDDSLVVISNARVLGEGIDVPAVDSIAFVDNRGSAIDCIQAVGRALRRGNHSGPKTASVIVPVLLKPDEDPDTALNTSAFAPVWQVVRALSAHDDALGERLSQMRQDLGARKKLGDREKYTDGTDTNTSGLPDWLRITGVPVPPGFANAITVQTVRNSTESWDEYYGAAVAYKQCHDDDIPFRWITPEGLGLGNWWRRQRTAHKDGLLSERRLALLEKIGIDWDPINGSWMSTYEVVKKLAAEQGHFAFDEAATTPQGVVVTTWCYQQRTRRRAGKLSQSRIDLLDAINYPWDTTHEHWMRRYRELNAIYSRRKTLLRLPNDSAGATWLTTQHMAHKNGRLEPWKIDLMKKIGVDFTDRRSALWLNTYEQLKSFQEKEGHCGIPTDIITAEGVNIRAWITSQRSRKKSGLLSKDREKLLNEIGFSWNPYQDQWDARYAELRDFYTANQHLKVTHGSELNSWLYQQRKKYREGKLALGAQARLSAIDPRWHSTDQKDG